VQTDTSGHLGTSPNQTHDIFEGTEQIQQLVICRAISGCGSSSPELRFFQSRVGQLRDWVLPI